MTTPSSLEVPSSLAAGYILPPHPHTLLAPEKNQGWQKIRHGFEQVRAQIEQSDADVLVLYSTLWPSVIGHQVQANPQPEWTLVDEEWHELGSIPYKLRIDQELAHRTVDIAKQRGLHARSVNYHGFPIDVGSVVALKLINPENRLPALIISSNVYADRSETVVLGKACREAVESMGRKAIAVVSTSLSNRAHAEILDFRDDHIHSAKDQEWNLKMLEFLSEGRLEDVAQLSRQFHREARIPKVTNFKPFWWLSSFMGAHNRYRGEVFEYQPIYGMGCAVVGLTPNETAFGDLEYDEENPDSYRGDRNVLAQKS